MMRVVTALDCAEEDAAVGAGAGVDKAEGCGANVTVELEADVSLALFMSQPTSNNANGR